MEQLPSLDADTSSASQKKKTPRILWNPTVHYRFHKTTPRI
jgi:hypothetical protein